MNDVKRMENTVNKSVVRITETPISRSKDMTQIYLKSVALESNSLLKKLSTLPKINDYRNLMR